LPIRDLQAKTDKMGYRGKVMKYEKAKLVVLADAGAKGLIA
jgi:hypothetical protein